MPAAGPQSGGPTPGMHVKRLPVSSFCRKLPDGNVLIHFEHATGATTLDVPMDFAKGLMNQLQEVTGGIVTVTAGP